MPASPLQPLCRSLELERLGVTDATLQSLSSLHALTQLSMPDSFRVTSQGLRHLSQLTNLRWVALFCNCWAWAQQSLPHRLHVLDQAFALNEGGSRNAPAELAREPALLVAPATVMYQCSPAARGHSLWFAVLR